jgi:membrane-bound inhibitor of C-type lysozyme
MPATTRRRQFLVVACALLAPVGGWAQSGTAPPVCPEAAGAVCDDPVLSALAGELARLDARSEADPGGLAAHYAARIAELRGAPGLAADRDGISRGPFSWRCGTGLARSTFFATEPPLAWVVVAGTPYLLSIARSGSGARYASETGAGEVSFWSKGAEATVALPSGSELRCTLVDE